MIKISNKKQINKDNEEVRVGGYVNKSEEHEVEEKVRPGSLSQMVAREKEKNKILMMIKAAKKRKEPVDHILFYGPPGLGKTTFAVAIASEIGSNLHITSGPAIQKQGDLATILSNLQKNDVLFIDEIHRLNRSIEEILYPAMEEGKLDIILGKGLQAKTVRLDLQPFTLIGATTRVGLLSSPLRDRFGLIQRLDYYNEDELVEILLRATKILNTGELTKESIKEIALRSRGTARVALRIIKRIRDYIESYHDKDIVFDVKETKEALSMLGIDEFGLDDLDLKILSVMYKDFSGGPVGISTISASVSEDKDTLEEVYEPFLIKMGFIQKTSRGRVLTNKGLSYISNKVV